MLDHFDQEAEMSQPNRNEVGWVPIDVINAQWEALTAPRREQERLEAEKKQAEAQRRAEIQKEKEGLAYSDASAQEICERIAIGELLINVCLDEHPPTMRRCNQWLREHPEFNSLYQSAISDRLNVFEEEVIQIADDMRHDFRTVIRADAKSAWPIPKWWRLPAPH